MIRLKKKLERINVPIIEVHLPDTNAINDSVIQEIKESHTFNINSTLYEGDIYFCHFAIEDSLSFFSNEKYKQVENKSRLLVVNANCIYSSLEEAAYFHYNLKSGKSDLIFTLSIENAKFHTVVLMNND